MRTPAGKDCSYFYGDYYRGRNREECRLLKDSSIDWAPRLCEKCPVPEIQLANSCEHLVFSPTIVKPFLIGNPQVQVDVSCTKTNRHVAEPRVGCGECHPTLNNFVILPDDSNDPT
jgi:protein-arginine kinase activator protein McsA